MYNTFGGLDEWNEFSAGDDNLGVDIHANEDQSTGATVTTQELAHDDIDPWLRTPQHTSVQARSHPSLRLLISSPRWKTIPKLRSVAVTQAMYQNIAIAFGIPTAFIGAATAQAPCVTEFHTFEDGYGLYVILNRRAVVLTHDPATATTYCFAMGLCGHERENVVNDLRQCGSAATDLLTVASAWVNAVSETRARRFVQRKVAITYLESDGGMHWSDDLRKNKPLRSINFEMLTRKLTVLGTQLAWDDSAIDVQHELVDRVLELLHRSGRPHASHGRSNTLPPVELRMRQAKDLLRGLKVGTKQIRERVSVQLSTLYSLVSQRDNEISYATAVTSQRIAEASHRENAIMKQIANDSKEVALRSYKDSASMRTIAMINLVTLPGTFTATFFSTSFFNFKTDSGVVSGWVWLYGVITIGLTVLLVSPWYFSSRKVDRELAKLRSSSSHDDGEAPAELEKAYECHNIAEMGGQEQPRNRFGRHKTQRLPSEIPNVTQHPREDNEFGNHTSYVCNLENDRLETVVPVLDEMEVYGPMTIERGSIFTPGGLRFAKTCRVCARPVDADTR